MSADRGDGGDRWARPEEGAARVADGGLVPPGGPVDGGGPDGPPWGASVWSRGGAAAAAALTVAVAAFAGALLGAGRLGPPENPVAAPGLAALLASGPVAVLGAALVFARVRQRRGAPGPEVLRALAARGASALQLRLLAAGPVAAVALACGVVFPLPAAAFAALPPLHAAGRGFLASLGTSLAAGLSAGAVVAALALAAPRADPAHPRDRDAPAPRPWRRLWLDAALMGLSAAAGYAGWSLLDAPGGGLPALRPLAYAGAAGLLLGAALFAIRAGATLAAAALRLWPEGDAGAVLALRAAARGSAAVWPVALGALAAGAVAFALSGGPAAGAVGRTYRSLDAGADARVEETVPRPCGACSQPFQAFIRDWPFPDLGGLQAGLPGVTAAGLLVPGADQVTLGANGGAPATVWGIDPAAFGAVVTQWPSGMGASGPADLRLLGRAAPGGAIISSALAAQAGVGPGGSIQSRVLGVVPVLAVAPAWPGIGASDADWLVVDWSALQGPLRQSGPWTSRGFTFYALWRLAPDAGVHPALAALRDRDVTVDAAELPWLLQAGTGWLPAALWPLAAAAVLLWWWGWDVAAIDPRALPEGEAAVALASDGAVARARALLRVGGAAWGGMVGGLAGWAASALFWPGLGFADVQASLLGLRVPPLGGVLAAACAVAGVVGALRVPWPPPAPPLILPEPREIPDGGGGEAGSGSEPRAARPQAGGRAAPARRRRGLGIRAVALPAFARLRFGWPRLLGLAAGLLLAASVSATVPLYVGGALTRVLHAGLQPVNSRPAGAILLRYLPPAGTSAPPALAELDRLQAATAAAGSAVGLPSTPVTAYVATAAAQVEGAAAGPAPGGPVPAPVSYGAMTVDALSGLASHIRIVQGRYYGDTPDADGAIEALVTESAYTSLGLTVGGLYTVTPPGGGAPLRIRLVGVFDQVDPTGPYWPYRYYPSDFLVAPQVLQNLIWTRGVLPLGSAAWYTALDLTRLDAAQVPATAAALQRVAARMDGLAPGAAVTSSPYAALEAFTAQAAGLRDLLRLVSIPVIALALYFVAITAGLIVDADSAEIAVFASRGAGAGHIVLLYLLEWMLLAVPVAAAAPLPAAAFARLMGAADGFLRFRPGPPLPAALSWDAYASAAAAAAAGVVAALVPVVAALRRSVVEARQRTSRMADRPLWQRAYLDLAGLGLLGVLLLVFRSASLQPGAGAAAIAGDPGLYMLPAAFLAVCALLLVRVVGWAFRALDAMVGDRTPLPAAMPLRRIGRQPTRFAPVLLLLCFTAALGSYSAAAARTMDANLAAAVDYRVGAPLRLVEVSPCTTEAPEAGACVTYDTAPVSPSRGVRPMPPFALHAGVPGIAAAAEIETEPVTVAGPGGGVASTTLVLIDPATYGRVGWWGPRLDPLPLASYLGILAARPRAIFLSPGLLPPQAEADGAEVGVTDQLGTGASAVPYTVAGPVVRWPGAGVRAPFALAALGPAESALGIVEVQRIALIRPARGATAAAITTALAGRGILASAEDQSAPEVAAALGTPEWAGQSGLLSVGFLVALAVTAAGYLFYAALLLRGQITQFGLLRALGLPWGRLVGSVAAEQGSLLLAGGAAGTAVGLAAAALFLPLFRPAFSGPGAPPFLASGPGGAFGEVAGLTAALMAAVLGALLLLLRRLHVGETVKLEE